MTNIKPLICVWLGPNMFYILRLFLLGMQGMRINYVLFFTLTTMSAILHLLKIYIAKHIN